MRSRAARFAALLLPLLGAACERGTPAAEARANADLHALVDTMLPALARLAALEPKREIRLDRRSAEQVLAYVEERLDEEMPAARLDALHSTYALLGVIPDTLQLRPLLLRLYTEQIIGYYDPKEKTLYVVAGLPEETVAPVLAHELVHALQDQYANLDSLIAPEQGNDRQSAAHAALEGHATIVMFAYLAEQAQRRRLDPLQLPNPSEQLAAGASGEDFPVFQGAPMILRETLLFPYVGGSEFMYRLWQAEPRDRPAPLGRWLPQSTEQVLAAPERFLAGRDEPTELRLGEEAPEGWRRVGEDNTLGQLELSIVLAQHLGTGARADARGWDGDRYRLLEDAAGRRALVWYTVWDDAGAAERFAAAAARIAAADNRWQVARVEIGGVPGVRIVIAPPESALGAAALPQPRLAR